MSLLILVVVAALSAVAAPAQLDALLRDHVNNGQVQYSALRSDARLQAVVRDLSATPLSRVRLTPDGSKAFWINVYNVFTLKLICDNWPVKSIMNLDGGKVWDRKWITIEGQTYSLNQIEHSILRPMGDPRIHFALVCAARSCPPLRSEPYDADRLNEQLTDQARTFISDKRHNRFSASDQTARISKIFEWFAVDFGSKPADVIRYLAPYAPTAAQTSMKAAPAGWKITYVEYDWALNGN